MITEQKIVIEFINKLMKSGVTKAAGYVTLLRTSAAFAISEDSSLEIFLEQCKLAYEQMNEVNKAILKEEYNDV